MAKKKNPWLIEDKVAKKEATKSVKKELTKSAKEELTSDERKMMRIYASTHKRLKLLSVGADMKMIDYLEQLIGEKWEEQNG